MDSRARMSISCQIAIYHHNARVSTFVVSVHDVLVRVTKGKFVRYGGLLSVPVVEPVRILGTKNIEKVSL